MNLGSVVYKGHKVEKREDGYVYYAPQENVKGYTGRCWASIKYACKHIDILFKLDRVKAAAEKRAAERLAAESKDKKPARRREWKE